MSIHRPEGRTWMQQRLNYAASRYGEANKFAREIEKVYRGDYQVPKDVEQSDIEVVRPSRGYNIVHKMMSMLAIRAEKGISVAQHARTAQEERRVDKLERGLHAYIDEH